MLKKLKENLNKKFEKILEEWSLYVTLIRGNLLSKLTFVLIILLVPLALIWAGLLSNDFKIYLLTNPFTILGITFIFSFIFTIFLTFSEGIPFLFRLIILIYLIYFGIFPTLRASPNYLIFLTEIALAFPIISEIKNQNNSSLKLALLALSISQFPPFFTSFFTNLKMPEIFNILIKFLILALLFLLVTKASGKNLINNKNFLFLITFLGFFVNYFVSWKLNFKDFYESLQLLSNSLWQILTIPLWILLAGDLVDEVGRFGKVAFKILIAPIVRNKTALGIEILSFTLISAGLLISWFINLDPADLIGKNIPVWVKENIDIIIITTRIIAPLLIVAGIIGFVQFSKTPFDKLKFRYNQAIFALIIFSFQVFYAYNTFDENYKASLSGFPFILLILGFFWEPLKVAGILKTNELNMSMLFSYLLLLSGTLVMINLVWDIDSVAKVGNYIQILGGLVVGIPILLLRLTTGWDVDEKFIFRNFFIGYFISIFPIGILPNKFQITIPLGFLLSTILFKIINKKQIEYLDFLSLGFGTIAQAMTVWIFPLPIISLNPQWLQSLYINNSPDFLGTEHLAYLGLLFVSSLVFLILKKYFPNKELLSLAVSHIINFVLFFLFFSFLH
jgi:hypothetical protein